MNDQLGLSVRFIRCFDPEQVMLPTAFDRRYVEMMQLVAFLKAAPDYDPTLHDALIREIALRRLNVAP